jgi:pimeloyl-ACP methyl ester carboxylesterase
VKLVFPNISYWKRLVSKIAVSAAVMLSAPGVHAQQTCVRIMEQDSTLNNLVDPPGYPTGELGQLGKVKRVGERGQPMILIPGAGFGADIFDDFMERHSGEYKMYAVTIPGFGGTPAPPTPPLGTSFGEQTWTSGALTGLERLIEDEKLEHVVVVGHWVIGTQLATRLAAKHPDKVDALVLLSGTPRWTITDTAYAKYYDTPQKRIASIDGFLATRWFKTVTRETWDDNNFLPQDYAVNPVRALRLWREAASPELHVWVRYLCEFNAEDLCPTLQTLTVPTLVLRPGLEGLWVEGQNYMADTYCQNSWNGCGDDNPKITIATVPDSRACMWFDQPEKVDAALAKFLTATQ